MRSGAALAMPASVRRSLVKLGGDINVARRKRRMSVERVIQGAGISAGTLRRLEKGDPSVSIGVLAMVLLVLGEKHRLAELLDIAADTSGLMLDLEALPKRITRASTRPGEL